MAYNCRRGAEPISITGFEMAQPWFYPETSEQNCMRVSEVEEEIEGQNTDDTEDHETESRNAGSLVQ